MLRCDRDEQWAEALGLWVDRKVVTYLKENHSRFEEILKQQDKLAEKYPVIVPFFNEEGAIELANEEHKAVMEYLNLREKTEMLIREYHYYLGQEKVEAAAEAQKAACALQTTEEVKHAIDRYVDAVNCRWLMFSKLLYRYAVKDILNSSKETGKVQQDS